MKGLLSSIEAFCAAPGVSLSIEESSPRCSRRARQLVLLLVLRFQLTQ